MGMMMMDDNNKKKKHNNITIKFDTIYSANKFQIQESSNKILEGYMDI